MEASPKRTSTPPRARAIGRRVGRVIARIFATTFVIAVIVAAAYLLRPIPGPTSEALFQGIRYTRAIRVEGSSRAIVHTATIDLGSPGIEIIVSPGVPGRALPIDARTPSTFLREQKLALVVNGDFFSPWYSKNAFDFYPRVGDPVEVDGYAASEGHVYSWKVRPETRTIRFSRDGHASLRTPLDAAFSAISGEALVDEERYAVATSCPHDPDALLPRTAIGLDREERRMFVIVVDGRQPRYSDGLGLRALAEIAIAAGAFDVVNLDGGGSSALVAARGDGVRQLNTPIHTRIPGRERPVANLLGVRARRLDE